MKVIKDISLADTISPVSMEEMMNKKIKVYLMKNGINPCHVRDPFLVMYLNLYIWAADIYGDMHNECVRVFERIREKGNTL